MASTQDTRPKTQDPRHETQVWSLESGVWRPLSAEQIAQLTGQGCSCEDWSKVQAADGFDAGTVKSTHFCGQVRLGVFEKLFGQDLQGFRFGSIPGGNLKRENVARPSWPCFHGLEARATFGDGREHQLWLNTYFGF